MNRRQRRNLENGNEVNYAMYLTIGVIVLAIIAFILAYIFYGNRLSKQSRVVNTQKISSANDSMLNIIQNTDTSATSTAMGKSVNEMQNSQANENTTEKTAVNTSNVEKNVTSEKKAIPKENKENVQSSETEQATSDPSFIKPVDGDVIKDYSTDTLVYSNTLEEWTTHQGIDYAAEKTSIVKASADGKVKSIKNDPRYGLTVVLEHSNGFTSLYANLLSTEFITVGEDVKKGQTIATVGNTATFEIADETHLHFEILKDGVNVDPNLYIK